MKCQTVNEGLSGQVVLIAGASSGIGEATAVLAARAGATVIAIARREDRLQAMQKRLAQEGSRIVIGIADVTDREKLRGEVDRVLSEFGRIDIAVYAAGTNTAQRAMTVLSSDTWHNILDTNLSGAFYLAQAVLPGMRKALAGHIVFVSSTAAAIADLSGAAYQASKRGLLSLSHAIRLEERSNGIRTSCIMPGLTNTELVEKRPEKLSQEVLQQALQAEDVASTILHIMSLPPRASIPELLLLPTQV